MDTFRHTIHLRHAACGMGMAHSLQATIHKLVASRICFLLSSCGMGMAHSLQTSTLRHLTIGNNTFLGRYDIRNKPFTLRLSISGKS